MQQRVKVRFRKQFRKGKRQFASIGSQTEANIENLLFKRFARLTAVRRFVFGWVTLFILLIIGLCAQNIMLSNYYQTVRTVPGGTYKEGVLGQFTNANPLFATSNTDTTVSKLIFSGLLKYNDQGKLIGDLAQSYEVDSKGLVYTVKLKPGLTWHDGKPLTSKDALFTYKAIQNPDTRSPLQGNWKGIVVTAPDNQTIVFTLSSPLAAFVYNMTNGIVPQHILGGLPVADLRSSEFNTARPVGTGPFFWKAIQVSGTDIRNSQEQIALAPFNNYNGGKPKLDEFIVHSYGSQQKLEETFVSGQLTAIQGIQDVPKSVKDEPVVQKHTIPLKAANMVFFKTSSGILAEKPVRNALVLASNVTEITDKLDYPTRLVKEPLLNGQIGYDASFQQAAFNLEAAKKTLDAAGWKLGAQGLRYKDKKPLTFTLSAADTSENKLVTSTLKRQWRELGVSLQIQRQAFTDFQSTLANHSYDALLYGISIGDDPDVFVYWDGSQADIRSSNQLNFSEYKNAVADVSLESGRTRSDPGTRAFKYRGFLQAWQQDSPALGLYQPRMLYLTRGNVDGLQDRAITSPIERFENVHNWQIRQAKVNN